MSSLVSGPEIWAAASGVFLGYLLLVRILRWRRFNEVHKKYAGRQDTLTLQEAQHVMHLSSMWDMPGINLCALSFSLFKTYAIPTISSILSSTKEFSSKDLVSKRYADTEILICTWLNCPIGGYHERAVNQEVDPRAMIALARVNFLHSKYKILNDDYLYTMSLFVLEPITWAQRYGWRPLSSLECQALFVYWKEIGTRMKIQDIPETLKELREWTEAYEARCMVPASSNRDIAGYTMDELLQAVPTRFGIKAFTTRVVIACLDDPVRIAMLLPSQPLWLRACVKAILYSVAPFQRYLCLPRLSPDSLVPLVPPANGYQHPARWHVKPWYKPQSNGFQYLIDCLAVAIGYYDDMPGPQYKSEGYRLEEMGPARYEKSAHAEIMQRAGEMIGCPVTGVFS